MSLSLSLGNERTRLAAHRPVDDQTLGSSSAARRLPSDFRDSSVSRAKRKPCT